ncbi:MAG: zinc ribbon domain-containing protein, partial [Desulfobaccales bacterium]
MPPCPHCQAEFEEGQRYCNNCGSFLMHPEEGDIFCPQCGVRVSPGQQFCHECDAPLKAEDLRGVARPAAEASPPGPA